MIHELRIRGLGVIDEAVIPFSPGFTVLTGETGCRQDDGADRPGADHG